MTKSEFMRELADLLSGISLDERKSALQYYEDYFADAGITEEMFVPNSVGTPKQVADKIIKEAVYGEEQEWTSEASKNAPAGKEGCKQNQDNQQKENKGSYYNSQEDYGKINRNISPDNSDNDNLKLILGIVVIIVTFPIWIGIVMGIAGLLIGVLAAFAGMIIGFGITGITLIITAFLSSSLAGGILIVGTGMLSLALAVVLVIPLVMLCGRFLPWLVRTIAGLVRRLLGKKGYVS